MMFLLVGVEEFIKDALAERYPNSEGNIYLTADTLPEGIAHAQHYIPDFIIVDTTNPKVYSANIYKEITYFRVITKIIFIKFPEEKPEGLYLSPYDQIYKPVDLDELHLMIKTAINVEKKLKMRDPITDLFSDRAIEDRLRGLRRTEENWMTIMIKIETLIPDDSVKLLADMLKLYIYRKFGLNHEIAFVGRTENGLFIICLPSADYSEMEVQIKDILRDSLKHYAANEGFSLQMGEVSSEMHFETIGQIAESLKRQMEPVSLFDCKH